MSGRLIVPTNPVSKPGRGSGSGKGAIAGGAKSVVRGVGSGLSGLLNNPVGPSTFGSANKKQPPSPGSKNFGGGFPDLSQLANAYASTIPQYRSYAAGNVSPIQGPPAVNNTMPYSPSPMAPARSRPLGASNAAMAQALRPDHSKNPTIVQDSVPVTSGQVQPIDGNARVDQILKSMLNAARIQAQANTGHVIRSGLDLDKMYQALNPAQHQNMDTAIANQNASTAATGATIDKNAAAASNIAGQTAEGAASNQNLQAQADRQANQAQGQINSADLARQQGLGDQYNNLSRMNDASRTREDALRARDPYTQALINAPQTKLGIQSQINDMNVKNALAGNQIAVGNQNIKASQSGIDEAGATFDWNVQVQKWQHELSQADFALKQKQLGLANRQVLQQNARIKSTAINQILMGKPTVFWQATMGKDGVPRSVRTTIPGYGRPQTYSQAMSMLQNTGLVSPAEAQRAVVGAGYNATNDSYQNLLNNLGSTFAGGI